MQNTSFTTTKALNPDATQQLLLSYRKLILENLPFAIERAVKEAEIKLMLSINDSMDGVLRSDFSLSLQMLETRSHWLSDSVSKAVVTSLTGTLTSNNSGNNTNKADTSVSKKLSVVEKDDFEDWLAMNSAIRLIQEDLGYELNRLCYIFEVLSRRPVEIADCPVGPATIINAFQEGCTTLDIPSSSYPIIYKILGRILNSELKNIYGVLLSAAERYGISGTTKTEKSSKPGPHNHVDRVDSSPVGSHSDQQQQTSAETSFFDNAPLMADEELFGSSQVRSGGTGSATSASVNPQGDTYATLQTLINLKASVSGAESHSANSASSPGKGLDIPYVESAVVVDAVNQLQSIQLREDSLKEALEQNDRTTDHSSNQEGAPDIVDLSLKELVKQRLNKSRNEETRLCPKDNELIDITDRLFDTLLEQVGVSGILEKWLKKLKLSVLKIVLLDPSFFSNHNHPARLVVNQLAKLAGTKRTPSRSIERSLEYFTQRIIKEYNGDLRLFEELLIEINHLVSRQEEAFKRNSERVARAYEGQQRLSEARETVVAEIDRRIKGKKIPKIILSLLDEGGWRQLMLVTLLREGQESERFKESLAVVDQLVAWLGETADSHQSVGDNFEKDLEAPTFIDMIDRELKAAGQTTHSSVISKLTDYLVLGKKPRLHIADPYIWPVEPEKGEVTRRPDVDDSHAGSSRWHKRARMMIIGDWVEIVDEENVAQRMRLAWSGSKSFRFVFVDSQGMKDIDMSLDELAERMSKGKATLLDKEEVPVIDQGLHQMVQSVYEDLSAQASCDPLTGLLNRQSFERHLERSVADSMANNTPYVVCFLDIDQFKVVNNTYGHIAGDQLLKHVASIVRESAGAIATCGRVGGNEFGLIFDRCALKEGNVLCNNIVKAVEWSRFTWKDSALVVTVSAGIAEIDGARDTSDTVMKKASVACSISKENGRNRVTAYTAQDQDQVHLDEMMAWIKKIDNSLEDLLMLRCQEIRSINRSEGRSPHYEILLGVYDEDKNILPPVALIEAAEHFGRMTRVDKWVIHNTLRWMENNPSVVETVDGFSINLSGTSINEDKFLDFVLAELSATTVPRHKICFEVTETAAITNLSDATDFIKVLRKTGCKFSLDDFGTGLSSYAYIQKLPVDYIKIDGVFIKNIVNNKKDQALVKSINELAHYMGMETIAEFVENTEILSVLKLIGVDHAQGYGIGKPMPLNDTFSKELS